MAGVIGSAIVVNYDDNKAYDYFLTGLSLKDNGVLSEITLSKSSSWGIEYNISLKRVLFGVPGISMF